MTWFCPAEAANIRAAGSVHVAPVTEKKLQCKVKIKRERERGKWDTSWVRMMKMERG